jgi:hypothetical protein
VSDVPSMTALAELAMNGTAQAAAATAETVRKVSLIGAAPSSLSEQCGP